MAGETEIVARVELKRGFLQLVTQGERLLSERSRLDEPSGLAEILRGVDRDQPESARIRDRAGHGLRFSEIREHLLELTEPVERASQLQPHIDRLLLHLRHLGEMPQ